MWRVIFRISYTSDVGSGLRNQIVPILQALGLQHTATGTFESAGVDRVRAAEHLAQVLRALADPPSHGKRTSRVCQAKELRQVAQIPPRLFAPDFERVFRGLGPQQR